MDGWLGVVIMIALGVGFAATMIGAVGAPRPQEPTPEKLAPYECGMPAVGDARERQSVKFYLVAMIFLLFDIEVAFLYPWAMALRDLGWTASSRSCCSCCCCSPATSTCGARARSTGAGSAYARSSQQSESG